VRIKPTSCNNLISQTYVFTQTHVPNISFGVEGYIYQKTVDTTRDSREPAVLKVQQYISGRTRARDLRVPQHVSTLALRNQLTD